MCTQGKVVKNISVFIVIFVLSGWITCSRASWAGIEDYHVMACDTMARFPDYRGHDGEQDIDFKRAVTSGDWRLVRSYLIWGYATPENLTKAQKARVEKERISVDLIPYSARGDRATVLRYLRSGADPNVDAEADGFVFPLAWAARCDHPEIVEILLARGAKINAQFTYHGAQGWVEGSTALEWAVESGSRRSVAVLLAHHANPHLVSSLKSPPGFESWGITPGKNATVLDNTTDKEIKKMIRKALRSQRHRSVKRD